MKCMMTRNIVYNTIRTEKAGLTEILWICVRFESRPGHRLYLLRLSRDFTQSLQTMASLIPRLVHCDFLLNHFQLICYPNWQIG
jgi:hypothetical protein